MRETSWLDGTKNHQNEATKKDESTYYLELRDNIAKFILYGFNSQSKDHDSSLILGININKTGQE